MIGTEIRELRDRLGLSRAAFAQAIGSTPAKVGRMEFGAPTEEEVATIVAIYGDGTERPPDAPSAETPDDDPLKKDDVVKFTKSDTGQIVRGTWRFVRYVEVEGDGDDYVEVRGGLGSRNMTRCIRPENIRDGKGRKVYEV